VIARPYQSDAIAAIHREWETRNSTLAVLATGLGKTIIFAHVIDELIKRGRVMVLAHREELINQAAAKIKAVTGQTPEIEMAGQWADTHMFTRSKIIVSSIQTQVSGRDGGRMKRFDPAQFSAVVIDEAHHATADSYQRVIAHYRQNPAVKVLGVTATPDRGDQVALGQVFESVAYTYEIAEGVRDGWLVPITQRSVDVEALDLSQVRTTAGDLNGADLAEAMDSERVLHEIAHPTIEIVGRRKTLVFADSVAHAERLAEIFNRHRVDSATWLCGETDKDERRDIFRDFSTGKFQFLVNVGVATEGYDEPTVECVVMARPTKSRALYAQCVGRGTRVLPGIVESLATVSERCAAIAASAKPSVEVIDFRGNAGRHKLICTADILGGKESPAVIARATKAAENGEAVNMLDELDKAKRAIADEMALSEKRQREKEERERKKKEEADKRRELKINARYSSEIIDPYNVWDTRSDRQHEPRPANAPTERQLFTLNRFGIDGSNFSKSQASAVIGKKFAELDARKAGRAPMPTRAPAQAPMLHELVEF